MKKHCSHVGSEKQAAYQQKLTRFSSDIWQLNKDGSPGFMRLLKVVEQRKVEQFGPALEGNLIRRLGAGQIG